MFRFTIRDVLWLMVVVAVSAIGFAVGWFSSPAKVANEAGLIGIIATQADEIAVLKQIVETYKAAYGEPEKTL